MNSRKRIITRTAAELAQALDLFVAIAIAVCAIMSCSPDPASYNQAVAAAKEQIPAVNQFVRLFPAADHRISDYLESNPRWQSETWMYDRYVFSMEIDLKLAESGKKIGSWGPPRFWLREVAEVRTIGGQVSIK